MKTIAYVRVSTSEQATSGLSLEAQQAKLEAYCDLYDLRLVEVIVDAGESAKSLKRPGLQRALAMLRSGAADGLVITKLDRLTRSVADWQTLIQDYFGEKPGKQLCSVADSIDTRTAAGRLVLNVLLSVSEWERQAIGERTKAVLQHKISIGERCGKIRFGFDLADDGRTLIPNPEETEAIEIMQQLRDAGQSYRKIANEMGRRSIKTKAGKSTWLHSTVNQILNRAA